MLFERFLSEERVQERQQRTIACLTSILDLPSGEQREVVIQ